MSPNPSSGSCSHSGPSGLASDPAGIRLSTLPKGCAEAFVSRLPSDGATPHREEAGLNPPIAADLVNEREIGASQAAGASSTTALGRDGMACSLATEAPENCSATA